MEIKTLYLRAAHQQDGAAMRTTILYGTSELRIKRPHSGIVAAADSVKLRVVRLAIMQDGRSRRRAN